MPAGERITGKEGIIELTQGATVEEIPCLTEWNLQTEVNIEDLEAVCMASNGDGGAAGGPSWNKKSVGGKSFQFTTNHRWQEDQAVGTTAIAGPTNVGDEVTFKLYPNGNAAGKRVLSGSAIIQSVGVPSTANGELTQEMTFIGNGALDDSAVP